MLRTTIVALLALTLLPACEEDRDHDDDGVADSEGDETDGASETGVAEGDDEGKKRLRVVLKYDYNEKPNIQQLRRVSKPGLRRYVAAADIPRVRGGLGTTVLSTSRGIMSDREARVAKVGGEVICQVW